MLQSIFINGSKMSLVIYISKDGSNLFIFPKNGIRNEYDLNALLTYEKDQERNEGMYSRPVQTKNVYT